MFDVQAYLPYIRGAVKKFLGDKTSEFYEDLVQEGVVALMKAHKSFDEEVGVSFITYSRKALYGALSTYMRQQHIVPKKNNGNYVNNEAKVVHVDQLVEGDDDENLLEELLAIEDKNDETFKHIESIVKNVCTEREYEVFMRAYKEETPLKFIAEQLGVSHQRTTQIHQNLIKKLKQEKDNV